MGEPMLAALLAAGFNASGFDIRTPASYGEFAMNITDQPDSIPSDTKILLSVVRDVPQTESLLFGAQSLLIRLKSLDYLIVSSTVSPRYIASLKTRIGPIRLIDAPMSGAAISAQEARLSFMLGGPKSDIDFLMPLFQAMGSHFHHMGATGAGMSSKVLNNLIAAGSVALTRTALEWAKTADLDERKLLQLIQTSSGENWFASNFDNIEFSNDGFEDNNSIGLLKKDVEAAIDAAPMDADTTLAQAVIREVVSLETRK